MGAEAVLNQLHLFDGDQAERRRPRRARPVKVDLPYVTWPQLGLFDQPEPAQQPADPWGDDEQDDDPFVTTPVAHRVLPAHLTPAPETSGIRSVFDLAASVLVTPSKPKRERPTTQAPRHGKTFRDGDCTRHVAIRHDETEEWQERERQRRARQRVPKPAKKARTRGRKLLDLIGPGED